jgi:OmcA/MtrC family decaheme c-type cytochrome
LGLWYSRRLLVLVTLMLALAGCGGGGSGDQGPVGPPGPGGPPGNTPPAATALNIVINSVTINSAPVVEFTVTNEGGFAYPSLTTNDLRFNIAKLIPGNNGDPTTWLNYIVRVSNGAMLGTQERSDTRTPPRFPLGTLVDHGDGTYTYTFATDLTTVSTNCPAPCTTADGRPLDLSYVPTLTHRVGIQQANSSLPQANALFDFVPNGGVPTSHEIIQTANCNECHDKITAHGSRFETRLCVTCHNPGSWVDSNTPVDFKVMIHKIHRGEDLPSGSYVVGTDDFSDIVFPQDIRNCTKCHDGSDAATPQGDNWQMVPSMEACGSCHEDIDFSKDGSGTPPIDPTGHPGGIVSDNSQCVTCHSATGAAGSVAASHTVPGKAERAFFQYNILEICGIPIASNPVCPPTTNPTVKFSVTDPTGATTHQYGNAYNIRSTGTDMEFTSSAATLNVLVAWDTRDYTNDGGSGTRPSRADSVNVRTSAAVTDNLDGTFTLKGALVTPVPVVIPTNATGSGAIALEGHPAADDGTGAFTVQVPVNSEVTYFAITDSTPKPRRQVVDVPTRCDRCHDVLMVHGNNRNNNGQLCVMCHNPSNSDVVKRPKDAFGLPNASAALDGKREQSVDFKRMIHGIHAASVSNFDGTNGPGFREQGLVIYSGSGPHDYSNVRFPGVLSKCETCHLPNTYTLADRSASGGGNWELPAMNGIRGSTVHSYPNAKSDGTDFSAQLIDQTDDLKYSPIASVCSACHDSTLSQAHMEDNGGILDGVIQSGLIANQNFQETNVEACPVCHGPGKIADVKLVHDDAFAKFLGDFIP